MEYLSEFAHHLYHVMLALSPWLIFGLVVAGLLHVLLPRDFIGKHFGGRGVFSLVKAAAIGVPLPLCSCGVIPTAIGLRKDGASKATSMSFLISTPQTGADSIFVAASFLGWPFAIFKMAAAFVTGVIGGAIVGVAEEEGKLTSRGVKSCGESCRYVAGDAAESESRVSKFFNFAFGRLLSDIYMWLIIGVIASALISTFLDPGFFADSPFMSGIGGMLLMLVISLPMYVCSTGSVPIAFALIQTGLPPGAALVFLMAGPATNVATLGAIHRTFGTKSTVIYVSVVAVMSVGLGLLFDWTISSREGVVMSHHILPVWLELGLSGLLAILMVAYLGRDVYGKIRAWTSNPLPVKENQMILKVTGMTCSNCAAHVKRVLEAVEGVDKADVNENLNSATVEGTDLDPEKLIKAVEKAGYNASIPPGPTD